MSINSLTNAATARRADFAPASRVPQTYSEIAAAAAGMPAASPAAAGAANPPAQNGMITATHGVNTAMQVLFGYIPTEILTLYVAVVAAMHQTPKTGEIAPVTNEDWVVFFSFLVATPAVFWVVYATKLKGAGKPLPISYGTWPLWEMTAATIAYFAWAFALPQTPFRAFANWYSSGLAGVAVLVTSTALGLLAPLFQNKLE